MGYGYFKNGFFFRISIINLFGIGGMVVVGLFNKKINIVEEIRNVVFLKFI